MGLLDALRRVLRREPKSAPAVDLAAPPEPPGVPSQRTAERRPSSTASTRAARDHEAHRRVAAAECVVCGRQTVELRNMRCENCQGLSVQDQR